MSAGNSNRTVLTVAGSDPSGGAGIQGDLKTFSQLRVYGMAVIAAMTAQSTVGVASVAEVSPDFVGEQLDTLFSDILPDATKTGMLLTESVIDVVATKLAHYTIQNVVVDPVMVSSSGAALMNPNAVGMLRRNLLPLAVLVTPNLDEAAALTGKDVRTTADMERAAREIHGMGPKNVLIKGGHLVGEEATDLLFDGESFSYFRSPRISTQPVHGTGCVLSAAIASYVALGEPIEDAVASGKQFVTNAIQNARAIGHGARPAADFADRLEV